MSQEFYELRNGASQCTALQEMVDSSVSEADGDFVDVQEQAKLFAAIFGDSNSDCDDSKDNCIQEQVDYNTDENQLWKKVEEVEGLWHCSSFLSLQQQQSLLKAIDSEGWFTDPLHNQAMRFGDLPQWASDLSALIRSSIHSHQRNREKLDILEVDGVWKKSPCQWHNAEGASSPLPAPLLEREPLFDQMIVNSYQPGEGISAHVDLLRFEDGIAILSLASSCVMTFRVVAKEVNQACEMRQLCSDGRHYIRPGCKDDSKDGFGSDPAFKERPCSLSPDGEKPHDPVLTSKSGERHNPLRWQLRELDPCSGCAKSVDVLLDPGDLIITHGQSRYSWTHEIKRDVDDGQVWQGKPLVQQRRVSVTLRRLCPSL